MVEPDKRTSNKVRIPTNVDRVRIVNDSRTKVSMLGVNKKDVYQQVYVNIVTV